MDNEQMRQLGESAARAAVRIAQVLETLLAQAEPDSKRLRELSAVLKDMTALARELRADEARDVTVRFENGEDLSL